MSARPPRARLIRRREQGAVTAVSATDTIDLKEAVALDIAAATRPARWAAHTKVVEVRPRVT